MKGEGVPWFLRMETGYNYNWMKDVINPGLKPISDAHSWPTSQGASPPVCFGFSDLSAPALVSRNFEFSSPCHEGPSICLMHQGRPR